MKILRRLAALGALLLSSGASAQTILRERPDELISAHLIGTSAYAVSPSISDDGRFVAYQGEHPVYSFANTVYVTDRQAPQVPIRAGLDCNFGTDCELERPRISGNGRFVIFDSAQPFTAGVMSAEAFESDRDVFVWDRESNTTTRISVGLSGAEPDGESYAGDISRDGRYVVFTSFATNLVATPALGGAPLKQRTYWLDRQNATFKLVYEGTSTEARNVGRPQARITSNGRYVVAHLEPNDPFATHYAINWDALTATTGYPVEDYWQSRHTAVITPDRRRVAGVGYPLGTGQVRVVRVDSPTTGTIEYFSTPGLDVRGIDLSSGAGFLVTDACEPNGRRFVEFYGRDGRIARVDLHLGVPDCAFGFGIDLTPDGRYAVVSAHDVDKPGVDPFDVDTDGRNDIFLIVNPLWRPSPTNLVAAFTSIPANSRNVKVSTNGSIGVFESEIPASEFGPYTDTNGTADVFRYLADFQQIELVSTDNGVNAFPGGARNPAMSADGGIVVFEAPDAGITAQNLGADGKPSAVASGKAGITSVFLRRLVQNSLQRLSTSRTGGGANGSSTSPAISADGQRVAFATDATDINPGADPNAVRDVVAVDLSTGTRSCVSTCAGVVADGASDRPSISNNGQVAFESSSGAVQKAAGLGKASVLPQIVLRNLITGTSQVISRSGNQAGNGGSTRPSISSAGTVVAYQSSASNLDASGSDNRINVIRYAVGSGNQRVSRRSAPGGKTTVVVDGDSVQPVVSGDGRFISFQTAATNLADTDANGVVDLVLHDGRTQQLRRLAEGFGGAESNGASETPHLNHNGTVVGFHSFASNLDAESDGATVSPTSAPYERDNPLAEGIVFADAFE